MKKLSIEEKAQRYDEAIARASEMIKAMTNIGGVAKVDDIQYIFPELKESEDEKIRKKIIATIHLYYGEPLEDEAKEMIAWLEKQGEQKPTEWSEKDEDTLHCIIDALDSLDIRTNTNGEHEDHTEEIYWLKSLKDRVQPQPKQEWSEEDIVAIDCAVEVLSKDLPSLAASIERLKSLRPQNRWKPSDEQMNALRYVTNFDYGGHKATLVSLYEQLKKLK